MNDVQLKPGTVRLLKQMHSRRESHVTDRKNARGFWIFRRRRVRSVTDYARVANFPRAPKTPREVAQRIVDGLLAEARRFERRYGR